MVISVELREQRPGASTVADGLRGTRPWRAIGPGLSVLRSVVTVVLVAFAILVILPALITAQAAAAL